MNMCRGGILVKKDKLVEVKHLHTGFHIDGTYYDAISDINLEIREGEIMGVVGESGSGKSVLSMSLMKLLPEKIAEIKQGEILYKGENIVEKSETEMNHYRGEEISMIFQEPMTSLNPVFTIGNQLIEMIKLHLKFSDKEARNHAEGLLKKVGIPRADKVLNEYPHQLSGGMRQRVMIAMAISCNPRLLIADEPTTALDVTVQAQILELIKEVQRTNDMSVIFISHDLGVIAEVCDFVSVMYAGKIVESAKVDELFSNPKHPYTQLLLASIPKLDMNVERLETIKGNVPGIKSLTHEGCRFANRCPFVMDACKSETPQTLEIEGNHEVACHLYQQAVKS